MKNTKTKLIAVLIITIVNLLISTSIYAQVPQKMSYQAVIRGNNGQLITNQTVGMQISILQGSITGLSVYTETQTPTSNANGLVTLEIGTGTLVSGNFSTINWGTGLYFIKTESDTSGGINYTITGTSQLLSVPYALYAQTSNTLINGSFMHYIGELYGGGIVVSVWKVAGVEHGLIASLVDLSSGTAWSNVTSTAVGTTAQSLFDGQTNTTSIIGQTGHISSAALMCDTFSAGGFTDWYLPAIWELNECYNAAKIVNTILGATNGFQYFYYWSSTEYPNSASNSACGQGFDWGYAGNPTKASTSYRVRAVRKF